jgi:hypothetical protein
MLGMGLLVGLVYKLNTGIAVGLSGGQITTKTTPNEGIHRSVQIAVSSGLGSGLGAWLLVGLVIGLSNWLAGLSMGLISGSLIGLATGLRYGGQACLQHLVLRLALRYHSSIPRRYADFLDYVAERFFLRRVGADISSSTGCYKTTSPRCIRLSASTPYHGCHQQGLDQLHHHHNDHSGGYRSRSRHPRPTTRSYGTGDSAIPASSAPSFPAATCYIAVNGARACCTAARIALPSSL